MKNRLRRALALLFAFALLARPYPARSADDPLTAPTAAPTGSFTYDDDIVYRFSLSAPELNLYEAYRAASYQTASQKWSDEQIARSDESWLLYPAVLLCEVSANGEEWFPAKRLPADTETAVLSLTKDLLPALAENGAYVADAFTFRVAFSAAVFVSGVQTALSPRSAAAAIDCPETVRIAYILPEGADNGGNPSFLFSPPETDLPLRTPTKTGCVFTGWRTPGGLYVDAIPAGTRSLTLTATFAPRTYRITYVLTTRPGYTFHRLPNSENPRAYTYGTAQRLYNIDAPSGYVFAGWYRDPGFTGEEVTEIGAAETGDVLLYARWLTTEEAAAEVRDRAGWCDLDGDGRILAADARLALRSAVGLESLPRDVIARADFAGLGRLTANEARLILRVSVGLESLPDVLRTYGLLTEEG